jgi:hypothetical protein
VNEPSIEVGEAQEGLDVADFPWFRPILNAIYFGGVHREAVGRKDETKVLDTFRVELAFVGASVQSMLSEATQDLADVSAMVGLVVGVDENVVQVDYNRDVE